MLIRLSRKDESRELDMSSQTQIRVRFDEFATAASVLPQMKRAPRGASASIPSDTLLTADAAGVVVETFALS
jgi:hypothetical protein